MRPLLFVRADDFETFGIGRGAVEDTGAEVRVWEAVAGEPAPSLEDVDGVVMFGSSFNVEHADEQPFIHAMRDVTREALDGGTPFLGICFGAQVLAWTLGADIVKAPVREVGYIPLRPLDPAADDEVLAHYADGDMVFQWHMDTFALPDGAVRLAAGDDVANQAFRVGDAAWATQFHFEIDVPEMELWIDDVGAALQEVWGTSPEQLRTEAAEHHERHEELGSDVFRRFVDVVREHG